MKTSQTYLPFNGVDEVILDLDGGPEPWSVHLEVHVPGDLEPERVRAAAASAAARHPLARARIAPTRVWDRRRRWEVPEVCDEIPIDVVSGGADAARATLLSRRVDIGAGPAFALALSKHADGDRLMLNLHHAAGDGKSAHRLMTSIARAYARSPDPIPRLDLATARSLRKHAGAQTTREVFTRARRVTQRATDHVVRPRARVALERRTPQAGYGFELVRFDAAASASIMAKRGAATVNDLLLAALAVAISRFNATRGAPARRISVMMPVSLRPAAWSNEVVSNIVSFVSVSVSYPGQRRLGDALREVSRRTQVIKADREAGILIDILGLRSLALLAIKDPAAGLSRRIAASVLDTAVLSNLGHVHDAPDFGPAGIADEMWFSPPATMQMGPGIGATTLKGELHLALRYSRSQFDAAGAAQLAATMQQVLLE